MFLLALEWILILLTLLPMIPTGTWWCRIFDFPRAQILLLSSFTLCIDLSVYWFSPHSGHDFHSFQTLTRLLLLFAIVFQLSKVIPFTRLYKKELPPSDSGHEIAIMIANVRFDNKEYKALLRLIHEQSPDIIILTEVNSSWHKALHPLQDIYPYSRHDVRENGHGISLYSNMRLKSSSIRFLVSEKRPSIKAELETANGKTIHLWGLHPTPPGIKIKDGRRKRSRPRDAELLIVADEVSKLDAPCIIAGDLNDTAWSHTTRLFKRISGTLDPRTGRGLFSTYHTKRPCIRFPIDHVFVSKHFLLRRIRRLDHFGSDHFPMFVSLCFSSGGTQVQAKSDFNIDRAMVQSVKEEGLEKAKEYEDKNEKPPK